MSIIARVGVGLEGWYKIEAVRPDGRRRLLADWFPNLITNNGLNVIGTANPITQCMVGTGSSAPTVAQTQLDNRIATTTTTQGSITYESVTVGAAADHYASRQVTYRFGQGVAAGNLTEVAVGNSNTSAFSRALILDGGGNPTSITVLSDEFLDVTYQLRSYAAVADVAAVINISGTNYDTVLRPSLFPGSWAGSAGFAFIGSTGASNTGALGSGAAILYGAGDLGAITANPGGTSISSSSAFAAVGSYSNNSYERVYRYTWGVNNGNADATNIRFQHPFGYHKASFSPVIPKRNTNILTLDLKVSWARKTL